MEIDIASPQGNGMAIIATVRRLLQEAGREDEIPETTERMRSGDYRNLLSVAEEVSYGSITFYNSQDEDWSP